MKKLISVVLVVFFICIGSVEAFAYQGGPLDGSSSSTGYDGGVIFDDTYAVATPVVVNVDALEITKDPLGETKKAGEECVFTAKATGADYVRWYVITPKGETHLASDIPTLFKGVTVTGTQGDRLVLGNITEEMSGCKFYAVYTSGDLSMHTTSAELTIKGSVAPSSTPAPTPTPTPTPTMNVATGITANNTGNGTGGIQTDGTTQSFLGTNTQNYNANTTIGSDGTATEPSSGSGNNVIIENTSNKSSNHVGAYILAAVAGLVIVSSVLVMALYMKGKISLGKFEKFLGNVGNDDANMFDNCENGDYYNPDDFDDNSTSKK